jgi:hypothetical protein
MTAKFFEKAKRNKADEFYTQLVDVERELRHYKGQFCGKSVLCNCDDPYESNFFKYFAMNFNSLGLKRLIAVCYATSAIAGEQLPLFDVEGLKESRFIGNHPHKIEITEVIDENGDGAIDLADVEFLIKNKKNVLTLLDGAGDFRSPQCVALLNEADIVVTNPPFSLFREYVGQLAASGKKFLILGNQNAVTYKEIFKLFKDNQIWFGYDNGGTKWFHVPLGYEITTKSRIRVENGKKYFSMGNIGWFTNLDTKKRHQEMTLYKKYSPEEYPRYANYGAIEVSKVPDIPMDYDGEMGVPVTFLDKYNPEQFEIIGSSRWLGAQMATVAKKGTFVQGGIRFYLPNPDGTYRRLYDRIVIRRKGAAQ